MSEKLPIAKLYTTFEGGPWHSFAENPNPPAVNAIKYDNGRIWDTINGWRDWPDCKPLQSSEMKWLESLGWLFCQTDPQEWEWVKFHLGTVIANQGDDTWKKDLADCKRSNVIRHQI